MNGTDPFMRLLFISNLFPDAAEQLSDLFRDVRRDAEGGAIRSVIEPTHDRTAENGLGLCRHSICVEIELDRRFKLIRERRESVGHAGPHGRVGYRVQGLVQVDELAGRREKAAR